MVRITFLSFVVSALVLAQAAYAQKEKFEGPMNIRQHSLIAAPFARVEKSGVSLGDGNQELQVWIIEDSKCKDQFYIFNAGTQSYLSLINPERPVDQAAVVMSRQKHLWKIVKSERTGAVEYRIVHPKFDYLVIDYRTTTGTKHELFLGYKTRANSQFWEIEKPFDVILSEHCRSSGLSFQ
ncbi:hypothetical protein BGZ52_007879 [Haplosporangium bisporale]|nr:hypothetical protein BGZ52_007879 [Haplosporangium bisporale]